MSSSAEREARTGESEGTSAADGPRPGEGKREREDGSDDGRTSSKKRLKEEDGGGAANGEPSAEGSGERVKEEVGDGGAEENGDEESEGEIVEDSVTTPVPGGKKSLRGRVWRRNGEVLRYRCEETGTEFNPGDAVYVESESPDMPYHICIIQSLKMSKRDAVSVNIKWFYRTSEVPEQVYQLLIQDRHTEHHGTTAPTRSKVDIAAMNDPIYRTRELFISEKTESKPYSVAMLRGRCGVKHCLDIRAVKEFEPEEDTFFYTLSYNSETRRLASTQGEIRVGASHQALLPPCEGEDVPVEQRPEPWGEERTWSPERIHDHDLLMFLRAARSMAAFAAMYDGGSPEDGFQAASRDGITAHAIDKLHESDYDTGTALQALLKSNPYHTQDVFRKWPEEDIKSFVKGLRIHGKNFFRIREEFLPDRETPELVEFYYLWKKTSAGGTRPRKRGHRVMNVMRKVMKSGAAGKSAKKDDPEDLSSCSEVEEEQDDDEEEDDEKEGEEGAGKDGGGKDKGKTEDDGDEGGDEGEGEDGKEKAKKKAKKKRKKKENGEAEVSPYYCRHCYTCTSSDWHHAGPDRLLLCTDCRLYFKRYAELPSMDGEVRKREITEDELDEERKQRQLETEAGATAAKKRKEAEVAGEINLSLIEQDSKADGSLHPAANMLLNHHRAAGANVTEPIEIKAEVPAKNAPGIFSPVATIASPSATASAASTASAVGSLVVSQAAEVYGSSASRAAHGSSSSDVEVLGERRAVPASNPPNPLPTGVPPREPSPPPKPDGSECHRSQSAIFSRVWNRGEGNSCARTDMVFKPVPDSPLARRRADRQRRQSERETEQLRAEQASRNAQEMASLQHQMGLPPGLYNPAMNPLHAALAAGRHPFPPPPSPVVSAAPPSRTPGAASDAPSPLGPPQPPRHMYPPGFAPAPAPSPHPTLASMQQAAVDRERRHMEEQLRAAAAAQQRSAHQQYAERMALGADPLVRLQMHGISPEMPGVPHFRPSTPFPGLGALGGLRHPSTVPPSPLDPRFPRPGSNPADLLMRPPLPGAAGLSNIFANAELQRALEREAILSAAAHQQMQHQEEYLRLEQEARARQASSRP